MERIVLLLLALMLARIVFIGARLFYLSAKHPKTIDPSSRAKSELAAELSLKLRSLRSTFQAAPYFGLLGTILGILDALSSGSMGSRSTILGWLTLEISAAFLSTAAGILVAVTATCLHNYIRARLDSSELSGGRAGNARLPLRPLIFSFSFSLTAVPIAALSIAAFMTFPSFYGPRGLHIRLKSSSASETRTSPIESIVVAALSTKPGAVPNVYLNSKGTTWGELQNKLRSELEGRPLGSIVYVQADNDILWQHAMYVIDVAKGLHAGVVLLTIKPEVHRSRRLPR